MAIVQASYSRRGSDPRAAAKKAHQSARYYTERAGPDVAERRWYAADGRSGPFAEFQQEISAQARAHPYTYRLVLSTREADIGPDGYREVLGNRFTQYFFVEHHNTAYPHAHVLGYRTTKLRKADLIQVRNRLVEQEYGQSRTHALEVGLEPQPRQARTTHMERG